MPHNEMTTQDQGPVSVLQAAVHYQYMRYSILSEEDPLTEAWIVLITEITVELPLNCLQLEFKALVAASCLY